MRRGWKNQYFQTANMHLPCFWGILEAKYKASHDNSKNFAVKSELLSIFMLSGIRDTRAESNQEAGKSWAEWSWECQALISTPKSKAPLAAREKHSWMGRRCHWWHWLCQWWEQDTRPRAPGPKWVTKKQPWRVVLALAWSRQCGGSSKILSVFGFQREGNCSADGFFRTCI